MRRFFTRFFVVVGVLFTLGVIFTMVAISLVAGPERLPRSMVLEIDLEPGLVEHVPEDPLLMTIGRRAITVREVVDALHRAAEDDRVDALLVRVAAGGLGMGVVEELREAVGRFRVTDKPAILFSETFGEFGPGHGGYYLATAFEEIVLQPSGDVGLTGIAAEAPFVRGTLDRIGVDSQVDQREQYKSAAEIFTREEFSEPAREATEAVLAGILDEVVAAIAGARGMSEARVRALINRGPFLATEAMNEGLVDRLAYRDEVVEELRERTGGGAEVVPLRRYLRGTESAWRRGETVALIYGTGPILRGESGVDPLMGGGSMGSETVARAFRQAVSDPSVRAILFRVDSPGGSYVASDVIHREVVRAREQGVPVVVSMGNVAGSGGYLVSVGADRILAHPSTITGSIGVVAGKAVTREMWERLGVTWDVVEVGDRSAMWSGVRPYGEAEWERVQAILDRIYEEFVDRVADGRPLEPAEVEAVAQGRIWTGRQALELGLVDGLGGFTSALEAVREEAEIAPDRPIRLTLFPPERTLFQVLLEEGRAGAPPSAGERAFVHLVEAIAPLRGFMAAAGLLPPPGPVTMPPHTPRF